MRMKAWRERDEGHRNTGWRHELLHWLREPADWGRQELYEIRHKTGHCIHLVPGWFLNRACARVERRRRG